MLLGAGKGKIDDGAELRLVVSKWLFRTVLSMLLTIDHALFKVVDCTEEDVTVDFLDWGHKEIIFDSQKV